MLTKSRDAKPLKRPTACNGGPMMMVNGHYHEKLTPAKVDEILDGLK